jgi:hypothetical protein
MFFPGNLPRFAQIGVPSGERQVAEQEQKRKYFVDGVIVHQKIKLGIMRQPVGGITKV